MPILQKESQVIFIDPSELRETSNLNKHLADLPFLPLPDLEARTGADIMVSPSGLPRPINDKLLAINIQQGAKLIQVKFGHDLASSIIDGRLTEALSRMLKAKAQAWQSLLLFVGHLGYDGTQGMATIDGQVSYSDPPLTWKAIQSALIFWTERGGTMDFPLSSGKLIPEHLTIHQNHLDRFKNGENAKTLWPAKPAFYEEMELETGSTLLDQWKAAQQIKRIEDIRVLLCAIPDAHIGPERATAILEFMHENGIRETWDGFLRLLSNDDPLLLEVPGIGKKTLDACLWGLWRTREEREARE